MSLWFHKILAIKSKELALLLLTILTITHEENDAPYMNVKADWLANIPSGKSWIKFLLRDLFGKK